MAQTPIQRRIAEYLAETETSVADLSRRAGLGDDGLRNILRGSSRSPQIDTALAIAKAMGITLAELVGEKIEIDPEHDRHITIDGTPFVRVPAFDMDTVNHTADPASSFLYRADWLAANGLGEGECVALIQRGDSMETPGGGIRAGDTVLVQISSAAAGDGIYWIVMDGTHMIRRLAREPGGRLGILTDNPARPDLHDVDPAGIEIRGRARWHGRQVA